MSLRAIAVLLMGMVWLSAHGKVCAQPEPPAEAQESAQAAEARRLYAEGKVRYAQGDFVEAIALFERSYALSEAPGLLFNMAQAHRLLGEAHCPEALALYRSYLAALPGAENRREVEERIDELERCTAPVPAPEASTVSPPASAAPTPEEPPHALTLPAPREPRRVPWAPVLLAGAGAAALVAGGVLYARASERHDRAEQECPCYPGTLDRWKRLTTLSYVLLGTGGAALAGGVSWWMFATPAPHGKQAMLGATLRF